MRTLFQVGSDFGTSRSCSVRLWQDYNSVFLPHRFSFADVFMLLHRAWRRNGAVRWSIKKAGALFGFSCFNAGALDFFMFYNSQCFVALAYTYASLSKHTTYYSYNRSFSPKISYSVETHITIFRRSKRVVLATRDKCRSLKASPSHRIGVGLS